MMSMNIKCVILIVCCLVACAFVEGMDHADNGAARGIAQGANPDHAAAASGAGVPRPQGQAGPVGMVARNKKLRFGVWPVRRFLCERMEWRALCELSYPVWVASVCDASAEGEVCLSQSNFTGQQPQPSLADQWAHLLQGGVQIPEPGPSGVPRRPLPAQQPNFAAWPPFGAAQSG